MIFDRVDNQDLFTIGFKFPPEDLQLNLLEPDTLIRDWYMAEPDDNGDTIHFWLNGLSADTILLEVRERFMEPDTLRLVFKTGFETRRELERLEQRPDLKIQTVDRGRTIDYFKPLYIKFSRPVSSMDTSKIILSDETDTLTFSLDLEGPVNRLARIEYPWKQEKSYKLFIPDSTFTDITGTTQDTTIISFNTLAKSDYGLLDLTVSSDKGYHYIIRIYHEKEGLINETIVKGDSVLSFPLIKPGNYNVRALLDRNKNGQWDTGHYSSNLQPEEVYFYPAVLSVRANWEVKETFELP
jgi:hypothetical protein